MKKYYAYVLKSEIDGRLYKGSSDNISRRITEHNTGKVKSTKGFKPWKLAYSERFDTLKEARDREKYFKTGIGREFIKKQIALVAQLDRAPDYGCYCSILCSPLKSRCSEIEGKNLQAFCKHLRDL